jgi:SAM-dependent methyltransferase
VLNVRSTNDNLRVAYDLASEAYARKFVDELDQKAFDRELLKEFAAIVATGQPVLDIGCGPGHTTAHLTSLGLAATGVDLSPRMMEIASKAFPESRFQVGDFFALPYEPSTVGGILAFYAIVHLTPDELVPAFAEMFRVLEGGGVLLLSFHVGSEVVHAENFLDSGATLSFTFFQPVDVETALRMAGFSPIDVRVREAYDTEYPSKRCYVFAHKPRMCRITS